MTEFMNDENRSELNVLVFDENDDGMLDNIVSFERNERGLISKVLLDFDGDNTPECAVFLEYDEIGKLKKKSIDKNLSGKINAVVEYDYDENGNPIVCYDDDADGKIDFIERKNAEGKTVVDDIRSRKQKFTDTLKGLKEIILGKKN